MRPLIWIAWIGFSMSSWSTSARAAERVTTVFVGGELWTGDPAQPTASGLVVVGDRIAFVGSSGAARQWEREAGRVVELKGRRVVPGFIDSHVHLSSGGDELLTPDLRSAKSEEEFARRLAAIAATVPPGTWLTSGAWDHENWPGARLPRKQVLDRTVPRHPVLIQRLDGHMAVANSLALRRAGVTRATRSPPGGKIEHDPETGEPTGVLKDAAMGLVSRHVPAWSPAERRRRVVAALAHAARLGVTGVHHMTASFEDFETYQTLLKEGELTTRITLYPALDTLERWKNVRVRRGFGGPLLKVNGLKGFADGSLGSSTAYFFDAYHDTPGNYGLRMRPLAAGGEMHELVRATVDAGLQPAIHAIGDRAIKELLDIFGSLSSEARARDARCRIEHAQHIRARDIGRFGRLGVIASMQPYHALDDGRWAEKRIGRERCETTYAFRNLIDQGATLAFGSDWPVAPLSPLLGIYAAVTRRTLDGLNPGGWIPAQKITVEEALTAYTRGSATAAFDEHHLGSLRAGYLADFVVLSEDILRIDAARIDEVKVDMTVVGGRVVYERL